MDTGGLHSHGHRSPETIILKITQLGDLLTAKGHHSACSWNAEFGTNPRPAFRYSRERPSIQPGHLGLTQKS